MSSCHFRLVIHSLHYSHRRFEGSRVIHLVDKEVGEEGIAQHRQAHPDTALSKASLRESLIVGGILCVKASP